MKTPVTITSLSNPLVKQVLQLKDKSRERKKTGTFIIEGERELSLAEKGDYTIEKILVCDAITTYSSTEHATINISKSVYEKIAHRGSTEGILAIVKSKSHDLNNLKLSNNPLILVTEAPEKPGNLGALLRTADAANLDAVLVANLKGDLYNPNTIRSSVGCVFTQQIAAASTEEIIAYLKKKYRHL